MLNTKIMAPRPATAAHAYDSTTGPEPSEEKKRPTDPTTMPASPADRVLMGPRFAASPTIAKVATMVRIPPNPARVDIAYEAAVLASQSGPVWEWDRSIPTAPGMMSANPGTSG